eukprot:jgi/Pico_ML_1/54278/g4650.t1
MEACAMRTCSRAVCAPFHARSSKRNVRCARKVGRRDAVRTRAAPPYSRGTEEDTSALVGAERAINGALVDSVVFILDKLYKDRPYPRFYVLETIARVPYFAYICVLHLYETLGWWRRSDYIKVHFAETWNELHHLLIMEDLGGDKRWVDRFVAQHAAVAYFWVTCGMYFFSPRMAYNFAEKVESHAYETYDEFLKTHGEELKKQPPPDVAVEYYTGPDLFLFDEFQTATEPYTRRPVIENLYDVFVNIRNDEAEHCKTMIACQGKKSIVSPHSPQPSVFATADEDE